MRMLNRQEVGAELGRRCSRGEFERIFSQLNLVTLKTIKEVVVVNAKGQRETIRFNPQVAIRHPDSPKSKRKNPGWLAEVRGKRERFRQAIK